MNSRLPKANELLKKVEKSKILAKIEKHLAQRKQLQAELTQLRSLTEDLEKDGWEKEVGKDTPEDIYIFELTQCLSKDLDNLSAILDNEFYKMNEYKSGKMDSIKRFKFYKAPLSTKYFISSKAAKKTKKKK